MTVTETEQAEAEAPHAGAHEHEHPRDSQYVILAVVLAVITAAEVGTYYWEELFGSPPSTTLLVVTLFPMMIAKFIIVAGWFMHLRYDNPLYHRVFVFGLLIAIAVYLVAMTSMQFFSSNWAGEEEAFLPYLMPL